MILGRKIQDKNLRNLHDYHEDLMTSKKHEERDERRHYDSIH
jgi:hypothetical protein